MSFNVKIVDESEILKENDDSSDTESEEWDEEEAMNEGNFNNEQEKTIESRDEDQDDVRNGEEFEKNVIRQRMKQLLQTSDLHTPHHRHWMTLKHKEQLNELKPFQDEEMDLLLRDVLRRQDSRHSRRGVLSNLIDIIFTKEKAKNMRSEEIFKTPVVSEVWKFVTQSEDLESCLQPFRVSLWACLHSEKVQAYQSKYRRRPR